MKPRRRWKPGWMRRQRFGLIPFGGLPRVVRDVRTLMKYIHLRVFLHAPREEWAFRPKMQPGFICHYKRTVPRRMKYELKNLLYWIVQGHFDNTRKKPWKRAEEKNPIITRISSSKSAGTSR